MVTPAILVLTQCDRLTADVRRVLGHHTGLRFCEAEPALHRLAPMAALVVVHLGGASADIGIAGRIVRADPRLNCRIVGLETKSRWSSEYVVPTSCFDDILFLDTERWEPLLKLWADDPLDAAHRVTALRLLTDSAPESLWPVFESLMQIPLPALSVKRWGGKVGVNRTTLYRRMMAQGLAPSDITDLARALRLLAEVLSSRPGRTTTVPSWPGRRTIQRIFTRTLGEDSIRWMSDDAGDMESVRREVVQSLRHYFSARLRSRSGPSVHHPGSVLQQDGIASANTASN